MGRIPGRFGKSRLLVGHAKSVAKAERELNHFVAHEVRNPLAAALSALSFVSSAVSDAPPLRDIASVRDDLGIMHKSLQLINDLLRSMLDMHRAANKQMKIVNAPMDVLKDVFEKSGLLHPR
jgi:signal transduction histidine kinase